MVTTSAAGLVESLRALPILTPQQQGELSALQTQFPDIRALGQELIRRGWLTVFQANQLARGKGQELVLDQYVLLELVGQGGMGSVYKARQSRMNRLVALKVVRREALKSPVAVERFQREAKAAAMLAHPNIVTVFDNNAVNGVHYLVMEFLEGTDLARRVKETGPLPVAEACEYVRQAALGLQHAHEQGLVHRDIKPHNLMRTTQGTIKVMDLGLARTVQGLQGESATEGLTDTGAVMGTVDYIAPEQARNAKRVDIRADVYSLGCTLYHLLAGRVPYGGESMTEKLLQHQLEEAEVLERIRADVPEALGAVVRKMMAKKPEDRYETPLAVAQALEPFTHLVAARNILVLPRQSAIANDTLPLPSAVPVAEWVPPATVGLERRRVRPGRLALAFVALLAVSGMAWFAVRSGRAPESKAQALASSSSTAALTSPGTRPTNFEAPVNRERAEAAFQLGRIHQGKGEIDAAIGKYSEALALNPRYVEALNNRGNCYKVLRQYDKALADYEEAIRLAPRTGHPYVGRGSIFYVQDKIDQALADFNQAIQNEPQLAVGYNARGFVYYQRADYDRALADFEKAIQLDPKLAQAYIGRGRTHAKRGNKQQAEADFKRAAQLDPNLRE
jgi:serine/threonine protein kinase/Tfp pilus assembly protein PilF